VLGERHSRFIPTDEETDMTTTDTRQSSVAAVCEALGVPRQDWHLFSRWAARPLTPQALDALYQYVDVMIADRCRRSTDDLLAKLIELEVDGEELTVDDIRRFVAALVSGAV
jgi:cytochrome P450